MTKTTTDEWVHWFVKSDEPGRQFVDREGRRIVDRVLSYPAQSPDGQRIIAALYSPPRECAAAGCFESARPKSSTCSPAHARAVQRAKKPVPEPECPDIANTPPSATNDDASPQVDGHADESVIAHTAHISDPPARRCANCGKGIDDKRAGAKVCGNACRMAITRRAGAIAAQAELFDVLGQPHEVEP